jgi:two-component system LytT family response regulator
VLDYVLKPISIKEIQQAVQKIVAHFEKDHIESFSPASSITKIALAYSGGFAIEEISNIIRLQADDNYTKVFTKSGKPYLISRPLKDFERTLPTEIFIRVHKSHMINIQYLKDYCNEDGGIAILNEGIKIPVSKRKGPAFLEAIKKFSLMLKPQKN